MDNEELPYRAAAPRAAVGPSARRFHWLEPVVLGSLALVLNFAGNDRTGLWDRDEPRYAVCVREMRESGDWIHPTFNGEPRYHKPVLIYWLMGLATGLAGDNPFGARLVSGVAGAGTVIGVWWLGRQMLGPRGGWLSALIFATAPIVVAESKMATTDATLALWVFGAHVCLWVLSRRPSTAAATAFWMLLGLATLTKGPIGPVLIAASVLAARCCGWRPPPQSRLHWRPGLAGFLALTAPWFITVTIASRGEFLSFAVGDQIVGRLASDVESHGGFPGYYPTVSLLVFYPWSALLPAAILGACLRRKSNQDLSFLLGWAMGPLILLECFPTRLIHYYLPAFPACALLVGWLIASIVSEGVNIRRWILGRLAVALVVGIGLALAAVLVAGVPIVPPGLRWPMIVIIVILILGTLAGTQQLQEGASARGVVSLAVTWSMILLIFCGWLVPEAEPLRTARAVGERLGALSAQLGLKPVLLEYQEPGVIYALGHRVAKTRNRAGFFAHLEGGQSVLTVALPSEIEVLRSKFGVEVTPVDQVEGLDLTKGRYRLLQFAVVRQGDSGSAGGSQAAVPLQQTVVK
jgi:4-amino-4-deoxy-L-arabinose transferase-like glycosyltransferase